ncbi:Lanthionine synthetase C-like protein [Mucilaginibacter gotjawali]|uniref:Lanthionine synthetase C-like protein n=1 Tax=Mucilaginibacter gotjawali TaxID=1550579 RepID=A0A120MYQ4_9SPHI|nr:lanthionine synthetase LanC family protein [Mucilaginibacter gotjawali]BAU55616.1 Lanthionine synthetase C-like protein [Mucilaginibacter gotjawali]
MKTLRSKLESILKRIYIESDTGTSSSSLMIGDSGVALFRILYLKHFENSLYDDKTISTIQALAESLVSSNDNSFCYGNSGTKWFFSYLYQLEIIEECDYNNICLGDELIVESALGLLETKNYEFLNGAVGLAQYLLFSNYKLNDSFFLRFLKNLRCSLLKIQLLIVLI